jgi:hypothetical protein
MYFIELNGDVRLGIPIDLRVEAWTRAHFGSP